MPPRKSGSGSGPSMPSKKKGKRQAGSNGTAQAADLNSAGGGAAAGETSSSSTPGVQTSKLLKRLSTAPDIEVYAALADALTPEVRAQLTANTTSSSSSSGGPAVSLFDLAGALSKGLHLLENWAAEQGPAALEAMAALADGLAAAWGKARSADTARKLKLVHTLVDAGLMSGVAAAGQVLPVTLRYLLVEEQQQAAADQQQQQQGSSQQEDHHHHQQQQQQQQGPLPAGVAEQLQLAGALLRLINSASLWWPGKLLLGNTFSTIVVPACSMAEAVMVCSERRRASLNSDDSSSSSSTWSDGELAALTTAELLCSAFVMEDALPPRNQHMHVLAASGQLQHLLTALLASAVQALFKQAQPPPAAAAAQSADAGSAVLETCQQSSRSPEQQQQQAGTQQQQVQVQQQCSGAAHNYHELLWEVLGLPPLARSPEQATACRSAFGGYSAANVASDVAQLLYNTVLYRSNAAAGISSMRASMQDEAEQQQQQLVQVVPADIMVPLLLTCLELQQLSPGLNNVEVCTRLMCAVHHLCSHSYAGASEQEVQAAALTAAVTADLLVKPFLLELSPILLQAVQTSDDSVSSSSGGVAEVGGSNSVGSVAGMELLMPRQAQLFMYYQALLCEVLLAADMATLRAAFAEQPSTCAAAVEAAFRAFAATAAVQPGDLTHKCQIADTIGHLAQRCATACASTAATAAAARAADSRQVYSLLVTSIKAAGIAAINPTCLCQQYNGAMFAAVAAESAMALGDAHWQAAESRTSTDNGSSTQQPVGSAAATEALQTAVALAARCLVLVGSLLQQAPVWPVPCMDEDDAIVEIVLAMASRTEQLLRRAAVTASWILCHLPAALPAAALEAPCAKTAAADSSDSSAVEAGVVDTAAAAGEAGAASASSSSSKARSSILQQLEQQAGELQLALGQAIQWDTPFRPLDGSKPDADPNNSSSSWGSRIGQAVRSIGDMFGEKAAAAALSEARERVSGPVAEQLLAFGLAVCGSVPARSCCNNVLCANTARLCEVHLVSGKSCRCAGCTAAFFCCKECQLASWKHHKAVCKAMQQQKEAAR